MNKYLSDKLKAISFLLMIMVVLGHSYNLTSNIESESSKINISYNSIIQEFLSQGLARVLIPLFFIFSGYLFFLNIRHGKFSEFLIKYKKRFRTLVVPYLFWSIFGVLLFYLMQTIPQSKPFFTHKLIIDYSTRDFLSVIFINPIPYQLWFLRDLILLIILTPLIYWCIKYFNYYFILPFFVLWVLNFDFVLFSNESILFYIIGSFFGIKKINTLNHKILSYHLFYSIIWIALVSARTILALNGYGNNSILFVFIHKLGLLFGVMAIWTLYDYLFKEKDVSKLKCYMIFSYSFFLYAFHEPLLTIIQKSLFYVWGRTDFSSLSIYLIAPILDISISIVVGAFLKNTIPKFYGLITGSR